MQPLTCPLIIVTKPSKCQAQFLNRTVKAVAFVNKKLFGKQTNKCGMQNSSGNLKLDYKQVVTESLFVVAFLVSSLLGACFANGWRNFDPPRVAPTQFRKLFHTKRITSIRDTLCCCVVSCFWAVMFPLDLAIRRRRMEMRINIICIYGYIYSV